MAVAGRVGVIVQARMRSRRLPGKVLRPLNGKPLLQYVLERVSRCARVDSIVVCTSTEPDDDPIEAFCLARRISCFRGDHDNVAKRFLEALARFGFDPFVRVCGDSPLIDPGLIDEGLEIYATGCKTSSTLGFKTGSTRRCEIVTNCLCGTDSPAGRRAFPSGQSVEVFSAETYRRGYARMDTPEHFEHVTRFFYEHAADFRIFNFTSDDRVNQVREGILAPAGSDDGVEQVREGILAPAGQEGQGESLPYRQVAAVPRGGRSEENLCRYRNDYAGIKLSVDTRGDFDRIAEVIGRMDRPHWEYNWREIVDDLCAVSP